MSDPTEQLITEARGIAIAESASDELRALAHGYLSLLADLERLTQIEQAAAGVRAASGIVFEDERVDYIEVQIGREDWDALGDALAAREPHE